jgi:threonine synthase
LPIKEQTNIISLKEGGTPLLRGKRLANELGIKHLYLKDETRNPTWSFKDRGSAVGVSKALEIRANGVSCVSSGNMAASTAAYAAKAGMRCHILAPAKTPAEKVVQMLISGATVFLIDRPYPEICKVGLEISNKYRIYSIHNDAPMRVDGQKTSSYEICEQLGWRVPDKVIIPTSSGGNISGHWKAWKELHLIGFTEELPSMVAAQAEGCCPIVKAFKQGREKTEYFENPKTIATAIANPDPPSGERVLKILKETKGMAEAVSDNEMLEAQKILARTEGLFAEPASAASIAVLKKLLEQGNIDKDETVVCVITGTGLKDVKSAIQKTAEPFKLKSWDEYRNLSKTLLAKPS